MNAIIYDKTGKNLCKKIIIKKRCHVIIKSNLIQQSFLSAKVLDKKKSNK